MEHYKCKSVGIVGAGIQGACIGLQLIKKGIPTTIFDRYDPLSENFQSASYGNAGHFLRMLFYNLIVLIFYTMFQRCFLVLMDLWH